MSLQMTLGLTLNAISLPGSGDGHSPSGLQDGQTIAPCGQVAAPVNLSARQAKEAGLLTSGTYGQRSFGSSASVALRQSLASRLHQRMASDGGILFRLTWKERVTPAGQTIYALRASGHSTSGKDSTGWQTPTVQDGNGRDRHNQRGGGITLSLLGESRLAPWPTPVANDDDRTPEAHLAMKQRMGERDGTGSNRTQITSLQVMAKTVAPWPTPNTMDTIDREHMRPSRAATGRQTGYLSEAIADYAAPASWATPAARDYRSPLATEEHHQKRAKRLNGKPLSEQAHTLASWPTPKVQNANAPGEHGQGGQDLQTVASGTTQSGSPVQTGNRGQLNPAFSRWLQGYPVEWDIAAILAHRQRKTRQKGG